MMARAEWVLILARKGHSALDTRCIGSVEQCLEQQVLSSSVADCFLVSLPSKDYGSIEDLVWWEESSMESVPSEASLGVYLHFLQLLPSGDLGIRSLDLNYLLWTQWKSWLSDLHLLPESSDCLLNLGIKNKFTCPWGTAHTKIRLNSDTNPRQRRQKLVVS